MKETITKRIEATKTRLESVPFLRRTAWGRGVKEYVIDLLDTIEDGGAFESRSALREALLNGADDWKQYSWGGCSLIYDGDIAERLCTASELAKTKHGQRRPNASEEWLDTQARALSQASRIIESVMFND